MADCSGLLTRASARGLVGSNPTASAFLAPPPPVRYHERVPAHRKKNYHSSPPSPQRSARWLTLAGLILVLLLALPGIKALFIPNYFSSHDGPGHVVRMEEFYRAFKDGEFPVRWSQRLYYGYGYPFFNFNYPSVYYLGLPFMLAGTDAAGAMKGELIVTFILSGWFMYWYLKRHVSWPYAVAGSVLYLYAPYRMLNLYVRGSVAESAAFMFPPLLLWSVEALAQPKWSAAQFRSVLWSSLVIFALGISHNISALIFFAFFFGYALFWSIARRSLKPLLLSATSFGLGLCMAAFFFVPALTEKKLTFLDTTIAKDYPDHFVQLVQLVKNGWGFGGSVAGPNDGLSFNIGYVLLGSAVVALLALAWLWRRRRLKLDSLSVPVVFSAVAMIGALFFMLSPSKFLWDHLPLLPFVQFPWRFLMVTVPALTLIATIGLDAWAQSVSRRGWQRAAMYIGIPIVLIGTSLWAVKDDWHINQEVNIELPPGDALEGTTTWAGEQATRWLVPKPTAIPAQHVEGLEANTQPTVQLQQWKTDRHEYSVSAPNPMTVVEHTMYYPGWKLWINGEETPIDYQNSQAPGQIVFSLPQGQSTIKTQLTESPSRLAMDRLSLFTLAGVILLLIGFESKALLK